MNDNERDAPYFDKLERLARAVVKSYAGVLFAEPANCFDREGALDEAISLLRDALIQRDQEVAARGHQSETDHGG
jgi:hypothetical protein